MSFKKILLQVDESQSQQRLDKFVAALDEIRSRTKADFLITEKKVLLNDKPTKSSQILKLGDRVEIHVPEEKVRTLEPYNFSLDIRYEDQDVIVVNKPSGLVVHPAAGHENDTLVNALLHHTQDLSMRFNEERPGIVHRIDKETSGLLVVAKNDRAHEFLVRQFQERKINRIYKALCFGDPVPHSGRIESSIGRHPVDRKRMASIPGGKWAATNYLRLNTKHGLSLVTLKLETGRTHQIRVHLSEKGHPLVGDKLYGGDKKIKGLKSTSLQSEIKNLSRFFLHAELLGFPQPTTQEWLEFSVDWPQSELAFLRKWELLEL